MGAGSKEQTVIRNRSTESVDQLGKEELLYEC